MSLETAPRTLMVGGLVIAATLTCFLSTPVPSLPDGSHPVETKTRFHLAAGADRVDGEITAYDLAGAPLGHWWLDRGRVYEPTDGTTNRAVLKLTKHEYFYDPGLDLGAWTGFTTGGDVPGLQIGLRCSPVRLFYGTVAPDIVATRDAAGLGGSLYLPAEYFGKWWNHVGVGAWYLAPYRGGSGSVAVGVSFSTLP